MQASLKDFVVAIPGATLKADAMFTGVSTNSQTVAPGNLFIALRGERLARSAIASW